MDHVGSFLANLSDILMYCSPATKVGAIVGGQTSVKTPEREAFEKYLPEDVHIVSCHSLHGPTVSPEGQPLVRLISSHRDSLILISPRCQPSNTDNEVGDHKTPRSRLGTSARGEHP